MSREIRATGALQHACVLAVPIDNALILKAAANSNIVAVGTIPKDALIIGNVLDVAVAFDDTGALTGELGDGTDPDRFAATPVDLKTVGVTQPGYVIATTDPDGYNTVYGVTTEVSLTIAGVNSDGEIGRATWYITYLRPDAAHGVS